MSYTSHGDRQPSATGDARRPLRVLLIEDDFRDRAMVRRFLENDPEHEHVIHDATTGAEGLAALSTTSPDVVLLDFCLPDSDGLQILGDIQRAGRGDVPIVFLTRAANDRDIAELALECGAQDYLVKDEIFPAMLRRTLTNAVTKQRLCNERDRAARDLLHFQEVTAALSGSLTPDDVVRVILERGVRTLRGVSGIVVLLSEDGQMLEMKASEYAPELVQPWQRFPLSAEVPIAEAVRANRVVTCSSKHERDERYPSLREVLTRNAALLAVPIAVRDQVLGGIGISFAEERFFTPAERELVVALGRQCGQALERARLYEAQARAAEADRQRVAFEQHLVAIVSHDLRAPLHTISMAVDHLLDEPASVHTPRLVQRIDGSARTMDRMIRELLDLTRSRLGSGIPIEPEPVDLLGLCEEAAEEARFACPGRAIEVRADGDARGLWDRGRLAQAIGNLVGNATKHGARSESIVLFVSGDESDATLAVTNRGEPISPAVLPRIFQPFQQGSPDTPVSRRSGLGLGLYIVQQIVRAHGGTIEVVSNDDATTFTVRLPRTPPELGTLPPASVRFRSSPP